MLVLDQSQTQALLSIPVVLGIWLFAWTAIAFPLFRKFQWRPFRTIPSEQKLILLLLLYCLAPLVIWGAIAFWRQSWWTIGVEVNGAAARSLVYGIGIAIGGLVSLTLLKRALRLWVLEDSQDTLLIEGPLTQKILTVFGLLLLGLWIGGIEELVFRGWLQTQLEIASRPWVAAAIGSSLFALAHLVWDGRAGLWQQPGLLLLGCVLVVARWTDGGSLALAWGLHAGWVWGLACMGELLQLRPTVAKPTWLTGLRDQPLTSVLDFGLMGATAALVWWGWSNFGF